MMDTTTRIRFEQLRTANNDERNAAMYFILAATEQPVDWAYEVWEDLLTDLRDKNNHVRAIAAQVLANLAKSDPEKRMLRDFAALLANTKDEKFVTARHTLQALWKIGAVGPEQQQIVVDGLSERFRNCASEKNYTLLRYDITDGLKKLYDQTRAETIREQALALIATELDEKYRKKYLSVWK